ncbi:uncharacterized protein [Cicer arietinum]|uniref:Transcription repressor n=1 Tax=Cicer arietinum TaxID=3827 RepID=A0A1S2YLE9_CICAR|nr:transcription repressor OFP1 [Cicer arietinum]
MGNNKFKLSDMIPNAWFYKLRQIGRGRKQTTTLSNKKKHISSLTSTTLNSSKPNQCNPRKSYYFTRDLNLNQNKNNNNTKFFTSPPSNSPKTKTKQINNNFSLHSPKKPPKNRTRKRRTTTSKTCSSPKLVTSSVYAGCICRTALESVWTKSDSQLEHSSSSSSSLDSLTESESPETEFRTDRVLIPTESSFDEMVSFSISSCPCNKSNNKDIDVDKNSLARKDDKLKGYDDSFSKLQLPPIITKLPNNKEHKPLKEMSLKIKILKEQQQQHQQQKKNKKKNCSVKKLLSSNSVNSPGVKLRVNSPRIATRKVQFHRRKSVSSTETSGAYRRSLSGSLAIVKSSFNPHKDFRESMVEMIVENNIRASKDLEDLLACYLCLNSDEYHDIIIKVFKQIWFDLTEIS